MTTPITPTSSTPCSPPPRKWGMNGWWWPSRPHTYSRTAKLFERFVEELKIPDVAILAEIFAAREQNTLGISSADLCRNIPGAVYCSTLDKAAAALRQALRRQEARRARALDAFLDGTLSREELAALTARSEAERSRLARRLADLEMAGAERPERRAALLDWLAGELAGGEAVLDAAGKGGCTGPGRRPAGWSWRSCPCASVSGRRRGRGRRGGLR